MFLLSRWPGRPARPAVLASILLASFVLLAFAPPRLAQAQDEANDTLASVHRNGTLRVCIWPDYYGITLRDRRTLQLSGIDIELALEFAHELGVKAEFVDSSFATLIEDLPHGKCEIAMFAIGVTEERARHIRFSSPHLRSNMYAITTRSNRRVKDWNDIDRPGMVVAVARGTYHEPAMREKLRHASLLVLDTPFAREQAVESGRADVFMADYPYSRRMLDGNRWARLIEPPPGYHLTDYAFAVRHGDDAWHARVQAFVHDIKHDGRLLAAARRNRLEAIAVAD